MTRLDGICGRSGDSTNIAAVKKAVKLLKIQRFPLPSVPFFSFQKFSTNSDSIRHPLGVRYGYPPKILWSYRKDGTV